MDISKLKVTELKDELTKLGLSTKGLKAELTERLEEALNSGKIGEIGIIVVTEMPTGETEVESESPRKRRGRSSSIETSKNPKIEETVKEAAKEVVKSSEVLVSELKESTEIVPSAPAVVSESTVTAPFVTQPVVDTPKASAPVVPVPVVTTVPKIKSPVINVPVIAVPVNAPAVTLPPKNIASTMTAPKINSPAVIAPPKNITPVPIPSAIVHVSHLTRPFTVTEFKTLLSSYGEVKDLWFDSLKSHSFVTFNSAASAAKCQKEMNGKRFPEQTGKLLVVELSSPEKMEKLRKESEGMAATAIGATLMNTFNNAPESQNIPLEELFKRTTAEPSIYYLPKNP